MVHLPGIISIYGKVYIFTEMGRELKSPPLPPVAMSLGPHVEFKNSPCRMSLRSPCCFLYSIMSINDNRDRFSFWSSALKIPLLVACFHFESKEISKYYFGYDSKCYYH